MSTVAATALRPPRAAFAYWHEVTLGVLLLVFFLVAQALEPRFVLPAVQLDLAGDLWPTAIVALAMAMIVITGGIDLSVGAMTGLCAVVIGLGVEAELNVWLAAVLGLATGAACGLFNAVLIARARIHPLIVTLATMAGFRGAALAMTQGDTIQGFPQHYGAWLQGDLCGAPAPAWAFLLAAVAAVLLLGRSPYGRFLYAMGHNEQAARLSGVPATRLKVVLYGTSGLACGVAAVLLTSRYEQAKADFATGLELEVITAVVLGGISIFGGRGNVAGLLIGLALLHECNKFIPWHWHVSELTALVTGALLVGSVLLNSVFTRTRDRS
ncbi:MAG: ABC transporter permease [Planctomycetota bacterium]|nr:MAG: ABC transporter permease [Planctomycetota bacterium]